jgi:hypothetical protein
MNSIFIDSKAWVGQGSPYFSSRVWVDGECVASLPFQYGGYEMPQYEALKALQALGLIDEKITILWKINYDENHDPKAEKVAIYTALAYVTLKECKAWANVFIPERVKV